MKSRAMRHAGATVLVILLAIAVMVSLWLMQRFDSDGAPLRYRSLNYDVQVLENGDLAVHQRVTIALDERESDNGKHRPWKQLYQRYTLDPSKLTSIAEVSVRNVDTGEAYQQQQFMDPAHMSTGGWNAQFAKHWYLEPVKASEVDTPVAEHTQVVELGWNIPATLSAEHMTFDIAMVMRGVATRYQDVVALQWEPFGKLNQVPIGQVTGVVRFPQGVKRAQSWGWLHFTGSSSNSRLADGSLRFSAERVMPHQYLDVVAAYEPVSAAGGANAMRTKNEPYRERLFAQEREQELQWRERQQWQARLQVAMWIGTVALGLALCAVGIVARRKARHAAFLTRAQLRSVVDSMQLPAMSPAVAAALSDLRQDTGDAELLSRQMASLVLSLASKRKIAVYPGAMALYEGLELASMSPDMAAMVARRARDERGHMAADLARTSTIALLVPEKSAASSTHNLSRSERAMFVFLQAVGKKLGVSSFDLEQCAKLCKHWKGAINLRGALESAISRELLSRHALRTVGVGAKICAVAELLLAALLAGLAIANPTDASWANLLIAAPLIAIGVLLFAYTPSRGLTERGEHDVRSVLGLRQYLLHYSDFEHRDVLDLTLWGRYLVYATAFGISSQAMEQLSKAYPQPFDAMGMGSAGGADDASVQSDFDASSFLSSYVWWSLWSANGFGASAEMRDASGVQAAYDAANSANADAMGGLWSSGNAFSDIGAQLQTGFDAVGATITTAANHTFSAGDSSDGNFFGGGFGGSFGGSGGGSFGGR